MSNLETGPFCAPYAAGLSSLIFKRSINDRASPIPLPKLPLDQYQSVSVLLITVPGTPRRTNLVSYGYDRLGD